MKKFLLDFGLVFVISFIVVFIFCVCCETNSRKIEIQFDRCVDGDTAWFWLHGKSEKVRFLGIDAPESVHPNGIVEDYGIESSNYTCSLLMEAKSIYLEYDPSSSTRDKYNRVLGWVFVDNNNISELLLSKGYAKVDYIYGDYQYIDQLCKVQQEAYDSRLGIWNQDYDNYQDNYCFQRK